MTKDEFTVIAHRGFSSKAPENTVAAFDLAIESGFTNIELDVQLSSDGVAVIIHDPTLDRTTSGNGNVNSLTLKELEELDAGSWFDKRFANQRIITLHELLERYITRTHLHIELKSHEPELPLKVVDSLQTFNALNSNYNNLFDVPGVTITSFDLEQLRRSLEITENKLIHSWLVESIDETIVETALQVGIKQLCPRAACATTDSIQLAISKGLTVRGQGVKSDEDVLRFYSAGVLGTTTNWPDKARALLHEWAG